MKNEDLEKELGTKLCKGPKGHEEVVGVNQTKVREEYTTKIMLLEARNNLRKGSWEEKGNKGF